MKTKDLIKELQNSDPSGELEVCIDKCQDIWDVQTLPAYYDGPVETLQKDPTVETYDIIGIHIKTRGTKISLNTYNLEDYIMDHYDNLDKIKITFDYEPAPNDYMLELIEKYKKKAIKFEQDLKEMREKRKC